MIYYNNYDILLYIIHIPALDFVSNLAGAGLAHKELFSLNILFEKINKIIL